MAELHSLIHAEAGPLASFPTRQEAEDELAAVLPDEPSWADELTVETFSFTEPDAFG